ncbi:Uncharacterised protein [Pseudomonas chlororaphis]|uniref:DUF3077 domain-containing protein n=1 Tax=Pseudomonas chlororaphis TaxID=587753 RepID=A0AAX3FTP4_9PSED|nr:Uncharacterised protein [Pseudomonas chlororaphis]
MSEEDAMHTPRDCNHSRVVIPRQQNSALGQWCEPEDHSPSEGLSIWSALSGLQLLAEALPGLGKSSLAQLHQAMEDQVQALEELFLGHAPIAM